MEFDPKLSCSGQVALLSNVQKTQGLSAVDNKVNRIGFDLPDIAGSPKLKRVLLAVPLQLPFGLISKLPPEITHLLQTISGPGAVALGSSAEKIVLMLKRYAEFELRIRERKSSEEIFNAFSELANLFSELRVHRALWSTDLWSLLIEHDYYWIGELELLALKRKLPLAHLTADSLIDVRCRAVISTCLQEPLARLRDAELVNLAVRAGIQDAHLYSWLEDVQKGSSYILNINPGQLPWLAEKLRECHQISAIELSIRMVVTTLKSDHWESLLELFSQFDTVHAEIEGLNCLKFSQTGLDPKAQTKLLHYLYRLRLPLLNKLSIDFSEDHHINSEEFARALQNLSFSQLQELTIGGNITLPATALVKLSTSGQLKHVSIGIPYPGDCLEAFFCCSTLARLQLLSVKEIPLTQLRDLVSTCRNLASIESDYGDELIADHLRTPPPLEIYTTVRTVSYLGLVTLLRLRPGLQTLRVLSSCLSCGGNGVWSLLPELDSLQTLDLSKVNLLGWQLVEFLERTRSKGTQVSRLNQLKLNVVIGEVSTLDLSFHNTEVIESVLGACEGSFDLYLCHCPVHYFNLVDWYSKGLLNTVRYVNLVGTRIGSSEIEALLVLLDALPKLVNFRLPNVELDGALVLPERWSRGNGRGDVFTRNVFTQLNPRCRMINVWPDVFALLAKRDLVMPALRSWPVHTLKPDVVALLRQGDLLDRIDMTRLVLMDATSNSQLRDLKLAEFLGNPSKITCLQLSGCHKITNVAVRVILGTARLPLEKLSLVGCQQITNKALAVGDFEKARKVPLLRWLDLRQTGVSPFMVQELAFANPQLTIIYDERAYHRLAALRGGIGADLLIVQGENYKKPVQRALIAPIFPEINDNDERFELKMSPAVIDALLHWVYVGGVPILTVEAQLELLDVACSRRLDSLKSYLVRQLVYALTIDNVKEMWTLAENKDIPELKWACHRLVDVLYRPDRNGSLFATLTSEQKETALKLQSLFCRKAELSPAVHQQGVGRYRRTLPPGETQLICADGRKIPVHKAILASSSEYFRTLFYGGWRELQEVDWSRWPVATVEVVLCYFYGMSPVLPQDIEALLLVFKLANYVQATGLMGDCFQELKKLLKNHIGFRTQLGNPPSRALEIATEVYSLWMVELYCGVSVPPSIRTRQ